MRAVAGGGTLGRCALALMLALAAARAAPTQDTLVVAREDTAATAPTPAPASTAHTEPTDAAAAVSPEATPAPATEAAQAAEAEVAEVATTELPLAPLKMNSMEVTSEVALRYAHTTVVTRMRNPADRAQQATFSLILPETAFISGFTMTLDGKEYKAYVKEKEEAKQVYSNAVAQGLGAAHISAKARDSNHFTVSVNVEPRTDAAFNLTYEELLERRSGVYNHAINLNPGRVVPRLAVTVHIKEGKRLTALRVPEMRTGNEVDAAEDDAQNPNALIVKSADGNEATVTFSPDIAEQQRLMDVYAQKTRESRSRSEHSFRPYYDAGEQAPVDGVLGQFVVQYDVEHSTDGEIFLNDGYFVHFLSPPTLKPLNKHIVFVLDTSGSMMDRKIAQLRDAMASILAELNAGDYFNIVEFASSTHVYELAEAKEDKKPASYDYYYSYNEQEKPVELVPPAPATPENIDLAKTIVSRLTANGGTNINEALTTALRLVNRGVGWTAKPTPKPVESTDTNSSKTTEAAATSTSTAASAAVADPKTEKVAKPESIIIFLTDGDPTVGEMDPKRIIKKISELNSGDKKAAIFSLAFGEDADRGFLRKLSLRNEGFMRHIYEAADAAAQLKLFYSQVSSPLLANVKFIYPPDQIDEGSLTKHRFHTLYKGSEAVVAGRVADLKDLDFFTPKVEGFCGVQDDEQKLFTSVVRVPVKRGESDFGPLERLWAYMTIKQKLDERDAAADEDKPVDKEHGPEQEALRLALKYSFVTPLTSLVVVKPNATSAVDAESVDKKQPYPSTLMAGSGYGGLLGAPMPRLPGSPAYGFSAGAPGIPGPGSYSYSSSSASGGAQAYPAALSFAAVPQSAPAFEYDSLAVEEEDGPINLTGVESSSADRLDLAAVDILPQRPLVLSTSLPPQIILTSTRAPSSDVLQDYQLQDFPWIKSYINAATDTVQLNVNSTLVTLKLLKDGTFPFGMFSSPGADCTSAIDGRPGACAYLPQCDAAKTITIDVYQAAYCDRDGFAGVCCPTPQAPPPSPQA